MDLVFERDKFYEKFNSFPNKSEKLKWVEELSKSLDNIYRNYTDDEYAELYRKYKLNSINDIILKQTYNPTDNPRIQNSAFKFFILYLQNIFLPFVNSRKMKLKFEVYYDERRLMTKEGKLTDEEKFPLSDYKYEDIKDYCENVFPKLSDKIEYYEYVLMQWDFDFKGREAFIELTYGLSSKIDIEKIRAELGFMKRKYKHEIDKIMLHNIDGESNNRSQKNKLIEKETPVIDIPKVEKFNKSDTVSKKEKDEIQRKDIKNLSNMEKPIWIASKAKLKVLLEELQMKQFIDDILDDEEWEKKYMSCFVDANRANFYNFEPQYINWKTELSDLGYLLNQLNHKGFKPCLNKYRYHTKISNVFLFQGGPLNPSSLASAVSKAKRSKVYIDILSEIILNVRNTM